MGTFYQHDWSLLRLMWITRLKSCVLDFSTRKYSFSPLFILLQKGIIRWGPHRRSGELYSSSSRNEYLQKLLGILLHWIFVYSPLLLCLFMYLSNNLFTIWVHTVSTCQCRLLGIYFILQVIIQHCFIYFVAHIVPSLDLRSSLIWILSLWYMPHYSRFFLDYVELCPTNKICWSPNHQYLRVP